MTITKRLLLTLSLALLGTLFVGVYGLLQLHRSEQRFDAIQKQVIPNMEGLNAAKGWLADTRLSAYRIVVFAGHADNAALDGALADASKALDAAIAKYESTIGDNQAERALIARDKANIAAYYIALQPTLTAARAGDMDAVRASLMPGTPLAVTAAAAKNGFDQHIVYNTTRSDQMRAENTEAYSFAFRLMVAVVVLSTLLTGVLAIHLYRIIRSSLADIEITLQNVSSSLDLTLRAPVARKDEIGLTAIAFNELMTRVMDVLHTVRAGTDAVGRAAKEIAAGNMDLSSRTEQQAAALEETASSMEELTATVKQNSDHAREASMLASKASAIAEKGNAVVSKVVGTMHGIAGSSSHINEITGVIEGIAFQTNILALNAAVEAARAGEQGRGFAVVASEVRSLAQRSSTAAKEIKDLIAESERQVHAGSTLVEEAGQTMLDVTHSIKQVTDIMAEIAVASEEQQRGIEQINRAITEMDTVTQQNAALVEEAAAASQALQDQGESLDAAVAVFGLGTPARAERPALSLAPATGYSEQQPLLQSNG